MRDRRKLRMAASLLEVQRARQTGAEIVLARARDRERSACREEDEAQAELEAARIQWLECVSGASFAPEFSRMLGERLVERDTRTIEAAARSRAAVDLRTARQHEWQQLEAEVRGGDAAFADLKRKVGRKREEDRLGEIADLATIRSRRS
jgi:hypothetical protein